MAMVANEEEGATVWEVELHPNQTISVSGKVVERNALAEINGAVVERLPVQ